MLKKTAMAMSILMVLRIEAMDSQNSWTWSGALRGFVQFMVNPNPPERQAGAFERVGRQVVRDTIVEATAQTISNAVRPRWVRPVQREIIIPIAPTVTPAKAAVYTKPAINEVEELYATIQAANDISTITYNLVWPEELELQIRMIKQQVFAQSAERDMEIAQRWMRLANNDFNENDLDWITQLVQNMANQE